MIDDDARPSEILAYAFNKHGGEGLEALLSRCSSWITKEDLEGYITEFREIGLTSLAAILEGKKERAPSKQDIRFCPWSMSYRSLEDMEDCRTPNGKCGWLINKAYW